MRTQEEREDISDFTGETADQYLENVTWTLPFKRNILSIVVSAFLRCDEIECSFHMGWTVFSDFARNKKAMICNDLLWGLRYGFGYSI